MRSEDIRNGDTSGRTHGCLAQSSTNQVKALLRSGMLPMFQAVYGQSCRRGHSCLIGVLFLVVAFECRGSPVRLVLDTERLGV